MNHAALALVFGVLTMQAQEITSFRGPVVISRCAARYTEEARQAKLEGTVVLYIEINPDGLADSIKVTRPLGMGLDENAVEALKQWRFRPAEKHGEPVTTPATVEVLFRLNDVSPKCRATPPE